MAENYECLSALILPFVQFCQFLLLRLSVKYLTLSLKILYHPIHKNLTFNLFTCCVRKKGRCENKVRYTDRKIEKKGEREGQRERERETGNGRGKEREKWKGWERERERQRERERETEERERERERERSRGNVRERERERER